MTTMYGIANCDTIKKAKKWLDTKEIAFTFHDYKKQGVDDQVFIDSLKQAIEQAGLETVVNKRGTTYRKLSEEQKSSINDSTAIDILREHPSMIKRPMLVHEGEIIVGFKDSAYAEFFKLA